MRLKSTNTMEATGEAITVGANMGAAAGEVNGNQRLSFLKLRFQSYEVHEKRR